MNSRLKNTLRYVFFLALAGLFLWLAFRKTDPRQLWHDISLADIRWLLLSVMMGYAAYVSRGLRSLMLLKPLGYPNVKPWNSIHAVAIGYFANLAVPRAGELARCTTLGRVENIPVSKLVGTVLLERTIDFIMLLLVMTFTFIVQFDNLNAFLDEAFARGEGTESGFWGLKTFLILGLVAVTTLLYLMRGYIVHHPAFVRVRNFWNELKEGFRTIRSLRRTWLFVLHTLFIWVMYYSMVYVCFFAVPFTQHLGPGEGLFLMVVGGFGMVVPVPGGIGAYHYLVMLALSLLGIAESEGMAFATLVHSAQTLMALFTGVLAVIFLYFERRKRRGLDTTGNHSEQDTSA